jgi:ABC-type Fe3+-siderophore transport system permease subunit
MQREVVSSGIGFGSALAIVISYTAHKSVLWAVIHGILSWFYVIYFVLTR